MLGRSGVADGLGPQADSWDSPELAAPRSGVHGGGGGGGGRVPDGRAACASGETDGRPSGRRSCWETTGQRAGGAVP